MKESNEAGITYLVRHLQRNEQVFNPEDLTPYSRNDDPIVLLNNIDALRAQESYILRLCRLK
jgi:hypothetical protein